MHGWPEPHVPSPASSSPLMERRLRRAIPIMSGLALVLALAALARTPGPATAAGSAPTCHGKPATYVGTNGADGIGSQRFLGHDPVLALRGGDDHVTPTYFSGTLTVCGGTGRDKISIYADANASSYMLDGGPGRDFVGNTDDVDYSELGPMTIVGGPGRDHLRGANARDRIVGGPGDDRAFGLNGGDNMAGGPGDDFLAGLGNGDHLRGGAGDDKLDGDSRYFPKGRDVADGGSGEDRCKAEVKHNCER